MFQSLAVVARYREPQLQVTENLKRVIDVAKTDVGKIDLTLPHGAHTYQKCGLIRHRGFTVVSVQSAMLLTPGPFVHTPSLCAQRCSCTL